MKKFILISISAVILLLLGGYALFSIYSKRLENDLEQIEGELSPIYNKVVVFSNNRIKNIKSIAIDSDCAKDGNINTLDGILLKRNKDSLKLISKDYNYDETEINKILNELFNCKNVNAKSLESLMMPLNDSLSLSSTEYNNKAEQFNNILFTFPNSLFVDNNKFRSKNLIRIDYLSPLENEIKKQEDIEKWIKTGEMPDEQKDTILK